VRVALREADLAERLHHRGTGEGLREEDHVRVLGAHLVDQPLPERNRLRVRVVDAEDRDAARDPEQHDVAQRGPEALPVLRVEVDVVDVLVALRRILGVLQRAVGAPVEPFGMLLEPRVVGRALDREVERDLEPELLRVRAEPLELLHRPELGIDRLVPALLAADRPRAARVVRARLERVVPALAVRVADRMNGREVHDVEAELREARQLAPYAFEAPERAWEELVPRAEACELPVDVDVEGLRPRLARTVARLDLERLLDRQLRAPEQHGAFGELAAHVLLAGVDLAAQLVLERGDAIDPRLDAVRPRAAAVHLERAAPLVVPERLERGLEPSR